LTIAVNCGAAVVPRHQNNNRKERYRMKIKTLMFVTVLFMSAALMAFAQAAPKTDEPASPAADEALARGRIVVEAQTAVYTVESIDAKTRDVVLRREDNSLMTYHCGPEVRNFDQLKVGDKVTATVAQELALALVKGGEVPPAAGTASVIVRAPKGAKPGVKMTDTVGFTAKVMKVNAELREVTLEMVDGASKTVKVGPDINLDNVKVGDDVGVRVTRAFAISVEAPKAAEPMQSK
jgi:hypothetical protein